MIIAVQFYNSYHGTIDYNRIEYPPSPGRLFSALVNAMYTWRRNEGEKEYASIRLLLEKMEHYLPDIIYPDAKPSEGVTIYVPENNLDTYTITGVKNKARKSSRIFPHGRIFYKWKNGIFTKEECKLFQQLVQYVPYLGTSRSMCQIELLETLPEKELEKTLHIAPSPRGNYSLPGYYKGRLADLDHWWEQSPGQKVSAPPVSYKEVRPMNLFSSFYIYRLESSWRPDVTWCTLISDRIRSTLLRIAEKKKLSPPTLIARDEKIPHLAILSLPFVGHEHATGIVMGIGIAIPPSDDYDDCITILSELETIHLNGHEMKLIHARGEKKSLSHKDWRGPSCLWTTVTPMELRWTKPRKGDETYEDFVLRRDRENKKQVFDHCKDLGLPEIEDIRFNVYPFISGSMPANQFKSRNQLKSEEDRSKKSSGFLAHCMIKFKKEIRGPLTLGRGRYFGLGLFCPFYFKDGPKVEQPVVD